MEVVSLSPNYNNLVLGLHYFVDVTHQRAKTSKIQQAKPPAQDTTSTTTASLVYQHGRSNRGSVAMTGWETWEIPLHDMYESNNIPKQRRA